MKSTKPFGLRLPDDIRQWLKAFAEQNMRSQNAEIAIILREKMEDVAHKSGYAK